MPVVRLGLALHTNGRAPGPQDTGFFLGLRAVSRWRLFGIEGCMPTMTSWEETDRGSCVQLPGACIKAGRLA